MKSILLIVVASVVLVACQAAPKKDAPRQVYNCSPSDPETISNVGSEVPLNNGRTTARAMKGVAAFSTTYAVTLCTFQVSPEGCITPSPSSPRPAREIDFSGASMKIDSQGILTIKTSTTSDAAQLLRVPASGEVAYMKGPGMGTTPNMYYVYFHNPIPGPGGFTMPKDYRVEVYYRDGKDYLCEEHMPDHSSPKKAGSGQGGVGGGTEPGH